MPRLDLPADALRRIGRRLDRLTILAVAVMLINIAGFTVLAVALVA